MNNDLISREALKEEMNKKALELASGGMIFIDTINMIIDNAPTVEPNDELLDYVNQSIEAEKNAMADYHDLASEDYHKGIIYAFECMKMKLM